MKWKQIPLGNLITLQRGYDLFQQHRRDGDVPVVTSSGVTGYHEEAAAKGPGVITGRYGTIGEVHYIEGDYWPHNTTLFVKDFKGNHPLFICYLLKSLNLAHQVSSGAVPGVNRNTLHPMLVPDVPHPKQNRIADVLSTYDELLENNRRRMGLLEESARQLYQEWFVRLRFPGHEHTSITHGLPEGWERKRVDQLCEIKGGKQIDNEMILDEGTHPVFGGNGIQGYTEGFTHEGFVIAFGRVGANCGSIHWAYRGAWINNNASGLLSHSHPEVLLHHLLNFDFSSLRKGAAQPFIPNGVLSTVEFLDPPARLKDNFCEFVRPMRLQQATFERQNQKLRAARDLLLPRLMSGEIAV